MKVVNKVRIIFLPAIILPIFLMVVSIAALSVGYIRTTNENIYSNGIEGFANPLKTMNNETKSCFNDLKRSAIENPAAFEDTDYLNRINQRLKEKESYLIIRKGRTIVYRGTKEDHTETEKKLPGFGSEISSQDSGVFLGKPENFLVKQQDFQYTDGSKGSAFILTDLETVLPHYKNIISQVFFSIVAILILTSFLLSWFMYSEFIRPLKKLKEGADRIKEGNLDDDVEINSKDEIGELCASFNAMRAELKESIEARIIYEKQNRDLISNISHDLKTPITAIKGYVEGIMEIGRAHV